MGMPLEQTRHQVLEAVRHAVRETTGDPAPKVRGPRP